MNYPQEDHLKKDSINPAKLVDTTHTTLAALADRSGESVEAGGLQNSRKARALKDVLKG